MKRAFTLLFAAFLLTGTSALAQSNGFYGRKIYVEFNGLAHYALFNQFGDNNRLYDQSLKRKSDLFNAGFNIGAGIAAKRDFMIGFETGLWYFNVAGPSYLSGSDGSNNYYSTSLRHEMLDVRTFSLLPTFTFGLKKGLLPIGVNHQVGVGYTNTKVLDKDYNYSQDASMGYSSMSPSELDSLYAKNGGFVNYKKDYKGFVAAYTLKVRIPVSKSVMINYGLRYTLNIGKESVNPMTTGNFKMDEYALYSEIRRARFRTLLTFNLGVTVAF